MSVTVNDILKLPCLRDARVLAGKNGLSKEVSSITVLEFAEPNDLQEDLFQKNEFYGSEIVITAFASIADNIDHQCANIRRMAAVGEVGLIVYYVGILLPRIDQKLIDLADELDFALIVMPENRMDLRYSEVISEVMELIFRDQMSDNYFVSDILNRMCRLPEHQRKVDAVLRMISDRIRSSLILADHDHRALGQANWPMSLELSLEDIPFLDPYMSCEMTQPQTAQPCTVWRYPIEETVPNSIELFVVKDGAPLSSDMIRQAAELVRLAVSLWNSSHADIQISELIRAILRDEPLKMRRLADLFRIDVASIHSMWILSPDQDDEASAKSILSEIRAVLAPYCDQVIADVYEGFIVAFMAWNDAGNAIAAGQSLMEQLERDRTAAVLTRGHYLAETADVRRAFLENKDYLKDAMRIWPGRRNFTSEEISFTHHCRDIIDEGEAALARCLSPLKLLGMHGDDAELIRTLETYLIDSENSVTRCAELLFVHKNTIKYRLGRIRSILGYAPGKAPENMYLFEAAAIDRLLRSV
ncbi:MAG: PucR family transcriptional regulator ligand-binding domain-containing protein [Lachnospiraceae bacterium]|nr:PucR family transcriptional regulator ligand-binding domain-containing protein [Lachnospiraceae bacterium]